MAESGAQAGKAQATLTITETVGGTSIEVSFSDPYRTGNPTLVQALAIEALDHIRKRLREKFPHGEDEISVTKVAKTH